MSSNASYPGALPPPPGVVPNLVDPDRSQQILWIACITVISVFPILLVPVRIYIRYHIMRKVTMVDYAVTASWVIYIPLTAVAFLLAKNGEGIHGWDLSAAEFSEFSEIINIHEIVWNPACALAKCALLLQLMEVFVTQARNARWWTLTILMVLNVIFFTVVLFLQVFECIPRPAIWDPNIKGTCINVERTFVATAAINLFDDLVILALPLIWIWQLHAAAKRKFAIALVFATGVFAILASTLRLITSIYSVGNDDISYAVLPISLWAQAEVSLAMIICCLPVLPRLITHHKSSAGGSSSNKHSAHEPLSASLSRSCRKEYYEMDEVEKGPQVVTTHSQSFNLPFQGTRNKHNNHKIDEVLAERGPSPDLSSRGAQSPARVIWKTVDIQQTSSEGPKGDDSSTEALR